MRMTKARGSVPLRTEARAPGKKQGQSERTDRNMSRREWSLDLIEARQGLGEQVYKWQSKCTLSKVIGDIEQRVGTRLIDYSEASEME